MSLDRQELSASCAHLSERAREAGAPPPDAVEIALGIVHHVDPLSPSQASAMVACWWPGWEPATLAALLAADRRDTIAAHYHPPSGQRKGYAEAARQLGAAPDNVAQAVLRGVENLYGWLAQRAGLAPRPSQTSEFV